VLTIYRRHRAGCKFKGRRAKCFCPIWAQGMLRGKAVRKSLDVTSWEAAQKIARDLEIAGQDIPNVKEAFNRFIEYKKKVKKNSTETVRKLELLSRDFEHFRCLINSLTADEVSKVVEQWAMAPSSTSKKLERLRSFFNFCVDRHWITSSPAKGMKGAKETAIDKKPYEASELEKIAWAIPLFPIKGIYGEKNRERIGAFVAVLRWTGLRIRDVVQLKWSTIADGYITLRTHKNGKPVRLPVHQEIDTSLSKLPTHTEYIFWSGEGNPKSCVGDWQRTFRRLDRLAGVHIHAHRWRHTFATDLLSKGVPVSEVAAILGNSPRIVERHYSQWIQSRQTAIDSAVKATWV
jgi:integrase/recombinase XerD